MELYLISFLAGVLTVLSPCVLPLLPVIVGTSSVEGNKIKPLIISVSLGVSVVFFTLLLKFSTSLINVDPDFWKFLSGGLVILFGVFTLFPKIWDKINVKLGLGTKSDRLLVSSSKKSGIWGAILIGASLGPVFSSCSPTYSLILATILPVSFSTGFVYLVLYALGLSAMMLVLSYGGQYVVKKLKWAVDPNGIFRKILGVTFILVGLFIISGIDKKVQTFVLDSGFLDITKVEQKILESKNSINDDPLYQKEVFNSTSSKREVELNVKNPVEAPELVGIANWINTEPLTMEELRGKVVVIDFWTYSCINCQRTLPYLKAWDEKYKDKGLVIVGVHAPEFAFEKKFENVKDYVTSEKINYPVALDNDFATWSAYSNKYWPAKYFIDKNGLIRHYHFGEGEYEESEKVIQYLLSENSDQQTNIPLEKETVKSFTKAGQTPETYLGYMRADKFVDKGKALLDAPSEYFVDPSNLKIDGWGLSGKWQINGENIISQDSNAKLYLKFNAKDLYLVLQPTGTEEKVKILINGENPNTELIAGSDLDGEGYVITKGATLYHLLDLGEYREDQLVELTVPTGYILNAFTFGSEKACANPIEGANISSMCKV